MQQCMFDCSPNPVVHLLLLKSSMPRYNNDVTELTLQIVDRTYFVSSAFPIFIRECIFSLGKIIFSCSLIQMLRSVCFLCFKNSSLQYACTTYIFLLQDGPTSLWHELIKASVKLGRLDRKWPYRQISLCNLFEDSFVLR